MERLLQHATTGVISVTPDGTMVTINRAARELLGRGSTLPRIGERLAEYLSRFPELSPVAERLETESRTGEPSGWAGPRGMD